MKTYIDNILLGVCKKLQLSPSLYEQATERYETIAKTLENDEAFIERNCKIHIGASACGSIAVSACGRS